MTFVLPKLRLSSRLRWALLVSSSLVVLLFLVGGTVLFLRREADRLVRPPVRAELHIPQLERAPLAEFAGRILR